MTRLFNTDSTAIATVQYSTSNHNMLIHFRNGMTYEYYGVPENIFNVFKNAESKGKFFNENIKNRYLYESFNEEDIHPEDQDEDDEDEYAGDEEECEEEEEQKDEEENVSLEDISKALMHDSKLIMSILKSVLR